MFDRQLNVFELALLDDLLFDPFRTRARLGLDHVTRFAFEHVPGGFRQVFRHFVQLGHRVEAEHELHTIVVPAVQMHGLRKIGVAPQADAAKAGTTT